MAPARDDVRLPVTQAERQDLPMFDTPELPVELAAADQPAIGDNHAYPRAAEPMRVPLPAA